MFQIQVSRQEAKLERFNYQIIKLLKQLDPPFSTRHPFKRLGSVFIFLCFLIKSLIIRITQERLTNEHED